MSNGRIDMDPSIGASAWLESQTEVSPTRRMATWTLIYQYRLFDPIIITSRFLEASQIAARRSTSTRCSSIAGDEFRQSPFYRQNLGFFVHQNNKITVIGIWNAGGKPFVQCRKQLAEIEPHTHAGGDELK